MNQISFIVITLSPSIIRINGPHLKQVKNKTKTFQSPSFYIKGSLRGNHHMKSNFIWVLLGNSLAGMKQQSTKERKIVWNPFVCSCPGGSPGRRPGFAEAEKAHKGHQPLSLLRIRVFPEVTLSGQRGGLVASQFFAGQCGSSGKRLWSQLACSGTPRPCFTAAQTLLHV